jgi:hypothetical protein
MAYGPDLLCALIITGCVLIYACAHTGLAHTYVEFQFLLEETMQAERWSTGIAFLFFSFGDILGLAPSPRRFTSGKETRYT